MKAALIRINLICLLLIFFIPNITSAELKTFIKEYTYQASEMDSKLSCRTIALEQVKRLLLEEVGTYLESQTEVKNFQLTKDQILTLTAGIVGTEIVDERWDGDNLKYWLKAKIKTDTDGVVKSIDDLRKDRQLVRDLEASRTKSDQLLKEIEVLKTKSVSRNSSKNVTDKEYYNKSINKLVADDWGEKGRLLARSNKYTEAIACFDKAIEINPEEPEFYVMLSGSYLFLKDYKHAIKSADKGVEIAPENARIFSVRGWVYCEIGNYDKAIKDLSRAIELDPLNETYYYFRGAAYGIYKTDERGMDDLKAAARLGNKTAQKLLTEWRIQW